LRDGIFYLSLGEVVACLGGEGELLREEGIFYLRFPGKEYYLWPWGKGLVLRNRTDLLYYPSLGLWENGWYYISEEFLLQEIKPGILLLPRWDWILVRSSFFPSYRQTDPGREVPSLTVILDPGHGGADTGAKGEGGVWEKDVTLGIALKGKEILEKRGHRVILTRQEDEYLPLRERVRIANEGKGDLFLSLHANSGRRVSARGLETFVPGSRPQDKETEQLLLLEEEKDLWEEVPSFLSELKESSRREGSRKFAHLFQKEVLQHLSTEDRGVKQAPFFVLLHTEIPAFLVEVGFLTNPEEGSLLGDPLYQWQIARALVLGIEGIAPFLKQWREE